MGNCRQRVGGEMIYSELVLTTVMNDKFHEIIENVTGENPATVVQRGKKPQSKMAYPLSYIKAFQNPSADTSKVRDLFGFLSFGMVCMGTEIDMAEVTGWQHGLRCTQAPLGRRGTVGVIVYGDGEQWATAINLAGSGPSPVQEWGQSCYKEFCNNDLQHIMGVLRNHPRGNSSYFLENFNN